MLKTKRPAAFWTSGAIWCWTPEGQRGYSWRDRAAAAAMTSPGTAWPTDRRHGVDERRIAPGSDDVNMSALTKVWIELHAEIASWRNGSMSWPPIDIAPAGSCCIRRGVVNHMYSVLPTFVCRLLDRIHKATSSTYSVRRLIKVSDLPSPTWAIHLNVDGVQVVVDLAAGRAMVDRRRTRWTIPGPKLSLAVHRKPAHSVRPIRYDDSQSS